MENFSCFDEFAPYLQFYFLILNVSIKGHELNNIRLDTISCTLLPRIQAHVLIARTITIVQNQNFHREKAAHISTCAYVLP